jgi:hypothetical protein
MNAYRLFLAVILLSVSTHETQAQAGRGSMQLGIRISTPQATVNNAVSFRYFVSDVAALEALVGFDPWSVAGVYERFFPTKVSGLQWFAGGGGYVAFRGNNVFGATGITGLDYTLPSLPINMSVDWKPELNLVNNVNFQASALALSIRFVF